MTHPLVPFRETDRIKQPQPQSADQEPALERWQARVLSAAISGSGDPYKAQQWIDGEPIACFGNKTARELMSEGRVQDVFNYIDSLDGGAAG